MARKQIFLACEALSVEEHAEARQAIQQVAPELQVAEVEDRMGYRIDAPWIGAISGVISAITAVIGLWLQTRERSDREVSEQSSEEIVASVEVRVRKIIPEPERSLLVERIGKNELPLDVEIEQYGASYRITVKEGVSAYLISGYLDEARSGTASPGKQE